MTLKLNMAATLIVALLASCSAKKDQTTTADVTAQRGDSVTQNPASEKLFVQDTPEAKYADSLYSRFLRDNPTYYKENPMRGTFQRTEVVSNQLVDLENSPAVRVLQAICVFNKEVLDVRGLVTDLHARLLILEVKDRYVSLLASRDFEAPSTNQSLGTKHSISFVNFRVTSGNDAIGMVSEYQKYADGLDEQKSELTLFIIMENELEEVLKTTLKDSRNSYAQGTDYNPGSDRSMGVELKVFGATTMELFDLLESTEIKSGGRATSNSVRTLRWNGTRYE